MASGTVTPDGGSPVGTFTDLQTAINQAVPGDVLTLFHGHPYTGNFTLPAKSNPNNRYITVQSDAMANLPAIDYDVTLDNLDGIATSNGRVFPSGTPGGAVQPGVGMDQWMPKILGNSIGSSLCILTTAAQANYWL